MTFEQLLNLPDGTPIKIKNSTLNCHPDYKKGGTLIHQNPKGEEFPFGILTDDNDKVCFLFSHLEYALITK